MDNIDLLLFLLMMDLVGDTPDHSSLVLAHPTVHDEDLSINIVDLTSSVDAIAISEI